MRRLLICPLVLACAISALAQFPVGGGKIGRSFGDLAAEQRLLVSNYCRLDFNGARLSTEGWQQIRQLTSFRENPDFNTVFIVSRCQVVPNKEPSYDINVNYVVIGRYEEGVGYAPFPGTRTVQFETGGKEMHITGIDSTTPFVSRQALVTWLKTKLAVASTSSQRSVIENSIKALEASAAASAAASKSAP
ncbi:MAG: hypothetical protein ABSD88_00545 [Candidatus Korobacteraceae bacterium]|jgi:hypothetical protein